MHESKNPETKIWICSTCDRYLTKGSMPVTASINKLDLGEVPEELVSLNSLEQQLIALNLEYMKVIQMPKGKQLKVRGPVVCVRADPELTLQALPRPLGESQIVGLKLMRKLEYQCHMDHKLVDLGKVNSALKKLKEINLLYKDIVTCEISSSDEDDFSSDSDYDDCHEMENQKENLVITNSGTQSREIAHDTCLQPIDMRTEARAEIENYIYSVAPGQGKKPHSILENMTEAKSFPTLFPME